MTVRILDVSSPVHLRNSHGVFAMRSFLIAAHGRTDAHLALQAGGPRDGDALRIASGCLTGQALGCSRCDCAWQLDEALARLAADGSGLLTYHPSEEGRGVGLHDKVRALAAMNEYDSDSVDAHERLGLPRDQRTYAAAVAIVTFFGLRRVKLLSANPAKAGALEAAGVHVEPEPLSDVNDPRRRAYAAWQTDVLWG